MSIFATKYSEKNWEVVMEKWAATLAQAQCAYSSDHPILEALDQIMMSWGEPEEYSECVSKYLKILAAAKLDPNHRPDIAA